VLADWANTVVLVALGLGIGTAATLTQLLAPPALEEIIRSREPGEGLFHASRRRADEQAEIMTTGPRGFRLAARAQLALVAVLVLSVWLSPVELDWPTLLLGVGAGVLFTWLAFRLARSGKLRADRPSRLDPLADVDTSWLRRASEQQREQSPPALS
jgi:hypothetical protein